MKYNLVTPQKKVNCKQVNLLLLKALDPHLGNSHKILFDSSNQLTALRNNVHFRITLQNVKHLKMFEAIELIAQRELRYAVQVGNTPEEGKLQTGKLISVDSTRPTPR
jgi:hypothetical protein